MQFSCKSSCNNAALSTVLSNRSRPAEVLIIAVTGTYTVLGGNWPAIGQAAAAGAVALPLIWWANRLCQRVRGAVAGKTSDGAAAMLEFSFLFVMAAYPWLGAGKPTLPLSEKSVWLQPDHPNALPATIVILLGTRFALELSLAQRAAIKYEKLLDGRPGWLFGPFYYMQKRSRDAREKRLGEKVPSTEQESRSNGTASAEIPSRA